MNMRSGAAQRCADVVSRTTHLAQSPDEIKLEERMGARVLLPRPARILTVKLDRSTPALPNQGKGRGKLRSGSLACSLFRNRRIASDRVTSRLSE